MSLHRAGESCPLSWRLYLPEAWTADAGGRAAAAIPTATTYQSKIDLALAVLDGARGWGAYPGECWSTRPTGAVLSGGRPYPSAICATRARALDDEGLAAGAGL